MTLMVRASGCGFDRPERTVSRNVNRQDLDSCARARGRGGVPKDVATLLTSDMLCVLEDHLTAKIIFVPASLGSCQAPLISFTNQQVANITRVFEASCITSKSPPGFSRTRIGRDALRRAPGRSHTNTINCSSRSPLLRHCRLFFFSPLRFQVLVLRDGRLAGIVTPKDLLMRVVAKGSNPDTTTVSSVMTPNPDAVPPSMTVIEALREVGVYAGGADMDAGKF